MESGASPAPGGSPAVDWQLERRRLELVGKGLEVPPEQRPEWARGECADGPLDSEELLAWIEETDGDLDGFLDEPLVALAHLRPEEIALPEQIGGFAVLRLLGEGGMGTVYLAEQREPVHRMVALKVMRAALADDATAARFLAERQALARLQHPNVAGLYEAGTTAGGHPFFAMEWVDGPPVTLYCDAQRLGVRERLEIVTAVCRGVDHANRKQILHRDLKPSNVLVAEEAGEATPKIIDFGIARILGETARLTSQGLIGTPEYLCPEAIAGDGTDLDTRSEVYSLGLLLYELLVGVHPFDAEGTSTAALLRRIEQGDAERRASPSRRSDRSRRRPSPGLGTPRSPDSPRRSPASSTGSSGRRSRATPTSGTARPPTSPTRWSAFSATNRWSPPLRAPATGSARPSGATGEPSPPPRSWL